MNIWNEPITAERIRNLSKEGTVNVLKYEEVRKRNRKEETICFTWITQKIKNQKELALTVLI